jgi:hypothetical protein
MIAIQGLNPRAHPTTEIALAIGVNFNSLGLSHNRLPHHTPHLRLPTLLG